MANQLLGMGLRRSSACISARYFATSSARLLNPDVTELNQELKDAHYPRIGNRDIVGRGSNGEPHYNDQWDMPMPSIRFKANTPEVMALREKEKGDWKNLTLDEKKEREYRARRIRPGCS